MAGIDFGGILVKCRLRLRVFVCKFYECIQIFKQIWVRKMARFQGLQKGREAGQDGGWEQGGLIRLQEVV